MRKKYIPNKFERTTQKILYCAWLFDILCAGWFIYFEAVNIAVVGMLRTIYPFCLIMFLLPFDKPPKNKKFVDSLKVFDSTIEKNGLVSTLFSKSLLIGIILGIIFFTPLGIFQILKILDAIL